MISVNQQAADIAATMIADAERLGLAVSTLTCGTRVIDIGLRAPGGLLAGLHTANLSLGGMGQVSLTVLAYDGFSLPGVVISVDRPEIGCMASQYAGWGIRKPNFFAIGSGPARARARVEPLFNQLEYRDDAELAVLILEGQTLPDDGMAEYIARKCRLDPTALTLIMAPAACLAGLIQLSARAVATGMHKMFKLGFDVRQVLHGQGVCPIAPVVPDEDMASAHANDCVLYGARIHYTVRADDAELAELIGRIPSSASPDYGTPCYELFQRYGSFYDVDPLLFCPSEVTINNLASGRTFRAGSPNPQVLGRALLGLA
jgi:methenyltetrahydromethanopterin cyclohydrolase